ncbi:MAG: alanine dehydrogenase [Gemmatimonadales bacterium]
MMMGVPREIHRREYRVGLTPNAVRWFTQRGHAVVVEKDAGLEARFSDTEYEAAGARVVYSSEEAYKRADVICRVGTLSPTELDLVRSGSVICAFHHLMVAPRATIDRLMELEVTAIGYELIQDDRGDRSVLVPLSEMAGEMAVFIAAELLQCESGGRGIVLGAVPGIPPPTVLILGAGTVGRSAARRAVAVGAQVVVLDEDLAKLRRLTRELSGPVVTQLVTHERLEHFTRVADVVIGAVLIPGARAPYLVTEEMVKRMRAGSVIVDVSIDQGGCVETSRPTTLEDPTFIVHDVVHYCVPNMTANVARTASRALSDAVRAPLSHIADEGITRALREHPGLAAGVYLYRGEPVHPALAGVLGRPSVPLEELLDRGEVS